MRELRGRGNGAGRGRLREHELEESPGPRRATELGAPSRQRLRGLRAEQLPAVERAIDDHRDASIVGDGEQGLGASIGYVLVELHAITLLLAHYLLGEVVAPPF